VYKFAGTNKFYIYFLSTYYCGIRLNFLSIGLWRNASFFLEKNESEGKRPVKRKWNLIFGEKWLRPGTVQTLILSNDWFRTTRDRHNKLSVFSVWLCSRDNSPCNRCRWNNVCLSYVRVGNEIPYRRTGQRLESNGTPPILDTSERTPKTAITTHVSFSSHDVITRVYFAVTARTVNFERLAFIIYVKLCVFVHGRRKIRRTIGFVVSCNINVNIKRMLRCHIKLKRHDRAVRIEPFDK